MNLIGPVPNQGTDGWCWAYAAAGAIEASLRLKGHKIISLSPQSLVRSVFADPDKTKRFLAPTSSYGGRGAIDDPMAAAASGGNMLQTTAILARLSPLYVKTGNNTGLGVRVRRVSRIVMSKDDRRIGRSNVNSIKRTILRNGAALISYEGSPAWYNKKTASHRCVGKCDPNHAALVIGWDDTYPASRFKEDARPSADGAWLVRNNWGELFGDKGYFWLSYEDMGITDAAGFDAVPLDARLKRYGHDDFGVSRVIWMGKTGQGRMSAVFQAEENCRLTEIGFYAPSDGIRWALSVRVMRAADAGKRISDLRPLETSSGQAGESGFYTVPIRNVIKVNKDEWFAVELQATCLSSYTCKFPLAVEVSGGSARTDANARVGRGEGWFSGDGKHWIDGIDMGRINPCIEVYALADTSQKRR